MTPRGPQLDAEMRDGWPTLTVEVLPPDGMGLDESRELVRWVNKALAHALRPKVWPAPPPWHGHPLRLLTVRVREP